MWSCTQSKLLDSIRTHQVVAAPAVDDGKKATLLDDEEGVEEIVSLLRGVGLHLSTKGTVHNQGPVRVCGVSIKNLSVVGVIIMVT